MLGAIFCLIYERTGSLYLAIALHIVNNAVALAATADVDGAPPIAAFCGALALAMCVALRRFVTRMRT